MFDARGEQVALRGFGGPSAARVVERLWVLARVVFRVAMGHLMRVAW